MPLIKLGEGAPQAVRLAQRLVYVHRLRDWDMITGGYERMGSMYTCMLVYVHRLRDWDTWIQGHW
jgi:hypothetical protein